MEERREKERKTNKFCAKSNLTLDDFWRGWVGRGLLQLRGGMCGRGSLLLHRHAVGLHDGLVLLPRGVRVTPRHEHLVLGRQRQGSFWFLTHFLPRTGIPHSYGSVPTAHERGIHVSIRTFGFGVAMRKSNGSWGSHRGRLLLIHYTFGVRLIEAKSAVFFEMQRQKFTVSEVINELTWAGESTPGNLLGRNSVKQVCFYSS